MNQAVQTQSRHTSDRVFQFNATLTSSPSTLLSTLAATAPNTLLNGTRVNCITGATGHSETHRNVTDISITGKCARYIYSAESWQSWHLQLNAVPVLQHLIIDHIIFTSNDVVATISLEPVQHSVSINYRIDVINESDSFPLSEFKTSHSCIELNFLYNVNYTVTVIATNCVGVSKPLQRSFEYGTYDLHASWLTIYSWIFGKE